MIQSNFFIYFSTPLAMMNLYQNDGKWKELLLHRESMIDHEPSRILIWTSSSLSSLSSASEMGSPSGEVCKTKQKWRDKNDYLLLGVVHFLPMKRYLRGMHSSIFIDFPYLQDKTFVSWNQKLEISNLLSREML